MSSQRELAAFLFFKWNQDDSNKELAPGEQQYYLKVSQQVIDACSDILVNLENVDNSGSELQWYMYEVGKRYFGTTKDELNFWFKCIYTVVFQTITGPRIGEFIYIFGIEEFLDKLEKRLYNPFEFNYK